MSSPEQQQVFVRNDQGRLWGPVTPQTLELLIDAGHIAGPIQLSTDGLQFAPPGRFPELREFVPHDLWGATSEVDGAAVRVPPVLTPVKPQSPAAPVHSHRVDLPSGELPPEGDLAATSPIRLYYLAASSNHTGRLTLRLSDRTVEVHFRKGNPEYVSSDHAEDALGGFLSRAGLVSSDQLKQAEALLDKFGGDLVGALFGSGVLNPSTAFTQLAQRAQSILLKGLLAESGTFTLNAEDLAAHKAMPLGNRWAVLMDLVRRVPPLELRRRLAGALDLPIMKSGGKVALQDLRLTPQETRASAYIDGVRSLNLLARDLPQDGDHFLRLAFVLREMDIVSFASTRLPTPEPVAPPPVKPAPPVAPTPPAAASAPPPPTTPPTITATPAAPVRPAPPARDATPRPAAGPSPSRPAPPQVAPAPVRPAAAPTAAPAAPDWNAELKSLRELLEKRKGRTHFEVLGVEQNASAGQVKMAYFQLAKMYHPDTVPSDAPVEVSKLKADVFAAIGEAYRTLSDDASRAKYVEELKFGGGSDVDVAAILHAEELFQKGCILVKAKKFADAVEFLADAIATNPDEGEFYAWRGIARFFASGDRQQGKVEADRDLAMALKKNPRCAPAFFFQGQIAKLLGDTSAAEKFFKQTLDIQPDHLDAQRELRYLKR